MKVDRAGVTTSAAGLWAGAWIAWLLAGAASAVPPWRAEETLARDEQQAHARAQADGRASGWSILLGGTRQGHRLGDGWGLPEPRVLHGRPRRVRVLEGTSADVFFDAPAWPSAHAAIGIVSKAPATLELQIDGQTRARWALQTGWNRSLAAIGALTAGAHRVTLRASAPGMAVDTLAIAPTPPADVDRDSGFVGYVRSGLHERPAFVVDDEAARGGAAALVDAVHGWITAALVTLLTGLGWAALARQRGLACVAAALGFSTVALVVVFIALSAAAIAPSPLAVAACLAALGGVPLLWVSREDRAVAIGWTALAPAAVSLVVLTGFATYVVPPLDDQDLEVQATAFAMAHRLTPSTVTDRGTTWFFAHPPLLHTWVAGTFALSGRLGRVAYTDEAALQARARQPFDERLADSYPPAYYEAWKRVLGRFFAQPSVWPTRQVNVLLASAAVGVLAVLAGAIAGSRTIGIAAAAVLATFPEFLVRGAYGGYFAPTLLLGLLLLAAVAEAWTTRPSMVASALAFLSDQKGLLVPAAWVLAAPVSARWARVVPAAGGAAGLALFALWGLGIDAPTFVYDFAKQHVARRLAGNDIRLAHDGAAWYPSIPELWMEFIGHYGIVFTAAAVVAGIRALWSPHHAVRAAGVAVWLGAAVFSLTDWRQTKHLSLLAAPALVAIAGTMPASTRGRRAAIAVFAAAAATNLWTAAPLLQDFDALKPSTIW